MPGPILEQNIIRDCKHIIDTSAKPLTDLQSHYRYLLDCDWSEQQPDWAFVFQKVYLHACLKGRADMATWIQGLFGNLSTIQQIAYRQTFAYGKILLDRAKAREKGLT
jgi:hypothetical protein